MSAFCISFQIHLASCLKHYSFFDIGVSSSYTDEGKRRDQLNAMIEEVTLPALSLLLRQIRHHQGAFRIALCPSGLFLDFCERLRPDVIETLQALNNTGYVEFLNTTETHSLASIVSIQEFREQAILHSTRIKRLFGNSPTSFMNTGLIYSDGIAAEAGNIGCQLMLTGSKPLPQETLNPNRLYQTASGHDVKLLLTHTSGLHDFPHGMSRGAITSLVQSLSDMAGKNAGTPDLLSTLEQLPGHVLSRQKACFLTPSQAVATKPVTTTLSLPEIRSDTSPYDLTPWLGNEMQKDAHQALYLLETEVKKRHNPNLLNTWRILQDANHFRAMCTQNDGAPMTTPYGSAYDAYINFMNILTDLSERIETRS